MTAQTHDSRPAMPVSVAVPKLGEHRGRRRLWLEGMKLTRAGIKPGDRYSIAWEPESGRLSLNISPDGDRKVSGRVRHNRSMPIIDVGSEDVERSLGEGIERAQVKIYKDRITVEVHPDDAAARERISRLVAKVRAGEPLQAGSLAHGGGILDHALHTGLSEAGVRTRLAFAVEIDQDAIDIAASRNPAWDAGTMAVHAPLEQVPTELLPQCDILVAGLPCTGASKSGKAKNRIRLAEDHASAGALVVPFLQVVKHSKPVLVLLENVGDYAIHETILDGRAMGSVEDRKRLCLIAAAPELMLDLAKVVPTRRPEATLAAILENVDPDSERWRPFLHHLDKAARDKEAGKGFKFNVVTPDADRIGAMGAGYHKDRTTEPHILHPTDPGLARLLTPVEHARAKTVPPELVEGIAPMLAHRILGNSVIWEAWRAVGNYLAERSLATAGVVLEPAAPILDGPAQSVFSFMAPPRPAEPDEEEAPSWGR
jgi:DNA (cytosine-5)-methyltransferase 1